MRLVFNVTFPAMPCAGEGEEKGDEGVCAPHPPCHLSHLFSHSIPHPIHTALHVDTADASGEHASDAAPLANRGARASGSQRVRGGELHLSRLSAGGERVGQGEYRRPPIEHVRMNGYTFPHADPADAAALDAAFDAGEGCSVAGWFLVQKVTGSLRFAPHMDDYLATRAARTQLSHEIAARLDAAQKAGATADVLPHILRIAPDYSRLNMGHRIHTLSFAAAGVEVPAVGGKVPAKGGRAGKSGSVAVAGPPSPSDGGTSYTSSKDAPGHAEPASGLVGALGEDGTGSFKYFTTIVSTEVEWRGPHAAAAAKAGRPLPPQRTYQYSLTKSFVPLAKRAALPSVAVIYDTSPLVLHLAPAPRSLAHLAVRLCAVLGGLWALAAFADRWVHTAMTGVRSAGVAAASARAANAARSAGYMGGGPAVGGGGTPYHHQAPAYGAAPAAPAPLYGSGGSGSYGGGGAPPVAAYGLQQQQYPAPGQQAGGSGGGAHYRF